MERLDGMGAEEIEEQAGPAREPCLRSSDPAGGSEASHPPGKAQCRKKCLPHIAIPEIGEEMTCRVRA